MIAKQPLKNSKKSKKASLSKTASLSQSTDSQVSKPADVIPGSIDKKNDYRLWLSVQVDYLTIKLNFLAKSEVIDLLNYLFPNKDYAIQGLPWIPGESAKGKKEKVLTSGCGSGLIEYSRKKGESGKLLLQLSGEFWGKYTLAEQVKIISDLKTIYNCTATRIDIAIDDFTQKIIPLNKMIKAVKNQDVAGFQPSSYSVVSSMEKENFPDGTYKMNRLDTHYFGSRQSSKFVRIYTHKFYDGKKSLRYEAEFKQDRARWLFNWIASQYESLSDNIPENSDTFIKTLSSFAVQAIDFRNRGMKKTHNGVWIESSKQTHLDRCKRFDWWQSFIEIVADKIACKIPLEQPSKTVEKTINWLNNQTAKTLAVIYKAAGIKDITKRLKKIATQAMYGDTAPQYRVLFDAVKADKKLASTLYLTV
jgi:hypothetical protein